MFTSRPPRGSGGDRRCTAVETGRVAEVGCAARQHVGQVAVRDPPVAALMPRSNASEPAMTSTPRTRRRATTLLPAGYAPALPPPPCHTNRWADKRLKCCSPTHPHRTAPSPYAPTATLIHHVTRQQYSGAALNRFISRFRTALRLDDRWVWHRWSTQNDAGLHHAFFLRASRCGTRTAATTVPASGTPSLRICAPGG